MKDEGQLVLTDRCRPTRTGTLARVLVERKFAEPTTPAKESLFTEDELKALARWEYPG